MAHEVQPSRDLDGAPADAELIQQTLGGERAAYDHLVRRYERRLLGFLLLRTRDYTDAEDALQQAFVKAYVNLARYRPTHRFSTWLFTIAGRELVSLQRRRRPTDPTALVECAEGRPTDPDPLPEPEPGQGAPPAGSLWTQARTLLGTEQYIALWLRYAEGMSEREISAIVGRSRVWVKVTLFRARKLLAARLTVKTREAVLFPGLAPRPAATGGEA